MYIYICQYMYTQQNPAFRLGFGLGLLPKAAELNSKPQGQPEARLLKAPNPENLKGLGFRGLGA